MIPPGSRRFAMGGATRKDFKHTEMKCYAQWLKPRPYKAFVITPRLLEVCLPTVAVIVLGSVLADACCRLGSLTCCGGRLVVGRLCSVWLLEVCVL